VLGGVGLNRLRLGSSEDFCVGVVEPSESDITEFVKNINRFYLQIYF
jgi:hypothetical protein